MYIEDRVVVITGATGVLGHVTAREFAAQGARPVFTGTPLDKLQKLVEDLRLREECALTVTADLGQSAAASVLVEKTIEKFGGLDILLHLVDGWSGGRAVSELASNDPSVPACTNPVPGGNRTAP